MNLTCLWPPLLRLEPPSPTPETPPSKPQVLVLLAHSFDCIFNSRVGDHVEMNGMTERKGLPWLFSIAAGPDSVLGEKNP